MSSAHELKTVNMLAPSEVTLTFRDGCIIDSFGRVAESVLTHSGSTYVLRQAHSPETQETYIVPTKIISTKFTLAAGTIDTAVAGAVYHKEGRKDGETITTSPVVSFMMNKSSTRPAGKVTITGRMIAEGGVTTLTGLTL